MGEQTFRVGESFTITTRQTIDLREGDMITDPATGITYYRRDGEIRTVGTAPQTLWESDIDVDVVSLPPTGES